MTIFYRPLPLLATLAMAAGVYVQFLRPMEYPWFAGMGAVAVFASALLMAHGRVRYADLLEKMLPTALLVFSVVFATLLAEGAWMRYALVGIGGLSVFLSLELLFLYAFMPSRYPVNGLSRVNIAYVPLTVFFTSATAIGLMTFLNSSASAQLVSRVIYVCVMAVLGVTLFRTTGHPDASAEQNRRWMLVGGLVGLHLGLLGVMLPLAMNVQGAVAMIVFGGILRMRRYLYQPFPSRAQAWTEFVLGACMLVALTVTSRWL